MLQNRIQIGSKGAMATLMIETLVPMVTETTILMAEVTTIMVEDEDPQEEVTTTKCAHFVEGRDIQLIHVTLNMDFLPILSSTSQETSITSLLNQMIHLIKRRHCPLTVQRNQVLFLVKNK